MSAKPPTSNPPNTTKTPMAPPSTAPPPRGLTPGTPLPPNPSTPSSSNATNPNSSIVPESIIGVDETAVSFSIKLLNARNLRGSKGEHFNGFVRIQFADFESQDTAVVNDEPNPVFDHTFQQSFQIDNEFIETFANKKVVLSLFESLPKEKTQLIGTTEISPFTTLLKPSITNPTLATTTYHDTATIVYTNPKLLTGDAKPEFEFEMGLSRPLLSDEDMEAVNFLYLRVDDLWPVPEEWSLKEGSEKDLNSNIYTYTLHISLPSGSDHDRIISITNGQLASSDLTVPALPEVTPIHTSPSKPSPFQTSTGSTHDTNDDIKQTTPQVKQSSTSEPMEIRKVTWSQGTYVVYLDAEQVISLRERIAEKKYLEAEIVREVQSRFAHVSDTGRDKNRGRVLIDCSQLIYPRVIGIKGRFAVDQFDCVVGNGNGNGNGESGEGSENVYRKVGCTLGVDVLVEKVLLDKKKLQPITKSVRDFIPRLVSRPNTANDLIPLEKQNQYANQSTKSTVYSGKSANRAVSEFKLHIQEIVRGLVKEYLNTIKEELDNKEDINRDVLIQSTSANEANQRKKKFLYHLNKSGKYFAFKEKLKATVVEVVRERYQKKSPFVSTAEMQLFMSEIYVYLVEQMHISLNEMYTAPSKTLKSPIHSARNDYQLLKQSADEAERDRNMFIAGLYHSERVAEFEDSLQVWYDYACFCMRTGQIGKGEECFKELLSRDAKHIPTLLAYGAHCTLQERFEEARVFLHTANDLQPKHALSALLLALYYDITGEEEETDKWLKDALSLKRNEDNRPSIFIQAAEFLVHCHAGQLAERALGQELISPTTPRVPAYLLLAKLEMQRDNYSLAMDHLKKALDTAQDNPNVWSAIGHLQYIQKLYSDAQASFETVLSLPQDAKDLDLVYTRLGSIYLMTACNVSTPMSLPTKQTTIDKNKAKLAKTMYLRACEIAPSSRTWLGVGRACFVLDELDEAEDSWAEGNVLNNRDNEIWAHLALLSLLQTRLFEANQAISQALRLGIKDPSILRSLGVAFAEHGQYVPATECLRLCIERMPNDEEVRRLYAKCLAEAYEANIGRGSGHGNGNGGLTGNGHEMKDVIGRIQRVAITG